jgi:hypothetical protein
MCVAPSHGGFALQGMDVDEEGEGKGKETPEDAYPSVGRATQSPFYSWPRLKLECGVPGSQVERPVDGVDTPAPNDVPWSRLGEAFDLIQAAARPEFMLRYRNIPGLAIWLLGTLPAGVIQEVRKRHS